MASLITSSDKVANIPSVYACYLKKYKPSSLKTFKLMPIHKYTNFSNNKVFNCDISDETILNHNYDIVYIDPPYNERQYSKNYHILNLISKPDNYYTIYGKTGLVKESNISKFCQKKNVENNIVNLIEKINTKYIFLSYSNQGLISLENLEKIASKYKRYNIYQTKYKQFKNFKYNKDSELIEYIIAIEK